jgi:Secretion system C-terminal sorting domain
MKKHVITLFVLFVWGITHAQPMPDMPIGKYKDNATPYCLYAGIFGSSPNYDSAAIQLFGRNFDAYYGAFDVNMTNANAIRRINPNFKLVRYQGAWQLTGASRMRVERNKSQVLHYRMGNLDSAISATQTRFKLADVFGKMVASTSAADSTSGYFQSGVFKYTTWLRIGTELMKIMAVNGNEVEVKRGIDNTQAQTHAVNAVVLSPVYGLNPTPTMTEELSYRNDEATTLRWENIYTALETEYNKNRGGIWIDIVVGNLSQFTQNGETVPANRIWDLQNNSVYDPAYRASRSEVGIKFMQDKFKEKFGIFPVIWGNNMLFPSSLSDARIKLLLQTTIKPRPMDAFAQENAYAGYGTGGNSGDVFNWTGYEEWKNNLRSIMFMGEQKISAVPLTMDGGRDNGTFAKLPAERKHKLFMYNYASYLLAVKVEADSSIYTKLGFTPVVDDNGRISFNLDPCFTWDIGRPTQTLASADFMQYKLANQDVWVRRFEKGIVMVNPTDNNMNNIDVRSFGTNLFNPDTRTSNITSISLPEHTGIILFFNTPTSTADIAQKDSFLYPNPANDYLNIENVQEGKYILDIFDAQGSIVSSKVMTILDKNQTVKVEIGALAKGHYIVHLRSVRSSRLNVIKRFVKM